MRKKFLSFYCNLLSFFARKYIQKHKPFVVGINGSVGKTSCRMIIYQTLYKFINNKKIYTSSKNFNGELGLSLSIFKIEEFSPSLFGSIKTFFQILFTFLFGKKPYDIVVLEYGIDTPGEMDFLLGIVKPNVGVFTAIDSVHSMQFGDPEKIAKEEKKMIQNTLDFALLNVDDKYAMSLVDDLEIDYLTYQTEGYDSQGDIVFSDENFENKDGKLFVNFDLSIKQKNMNIVSNILGKANYGYIGVALTILDILNYRDGKTSIFDKFKSLQLEYKLQPGRFSVFHGVNDSIIFDSTYNSSPLSVQKILNTVLNIKKSLFPDREIWVMLGDMRELGKLTESEHRKIAAYVHSVADKVFLVGENMVKYFRDELGKIGFDMDNVFDFSNARTLGKSIKADLLSSKPSVLLVGKGSQNTIFLEEAVKILLKEKSDVEFLTRQSAWWMNKKDKFFAEYGE